MVWVNPNERPRAPLILRPNESSPAGKLVRLVDDNGTLGEDSPIDVTDAGVMTGVLSINYTPVAPADWSPTPLTLQEALDQLAASIASLEREVTLFADADPARIPSDLGRVRCLTTQTVLLPSAAFVDGLSWDVKAAAAGVEVTLNPDGGDLIDGSSSLVFNYPTNITIRSFGSGWGII